MDMLDFQRRLDRVLCGEDEAIGLVEEMAEMIDRMASQIDSQRRRYASLERKFHEYVEAHKRSGCLRG